MELDVDRLCAQSATAVEALRARVRGLGSALVAFSGGVDSTFLLKISVDELRDKVVALTALSASMPSDEAVQARELAASLGVKHQLVQSHELEDPRYVANPSNRCYFCKSELFTITQRACAELGLAAVLDGFNADDQQDHRPGHRAAGEHQVLSPLAEAGLTKLQIRAWSKRLGLATWDKPQLACLASRLPYGTQVTVERLNTVGAAERAVKALGLTNFRVRHHGEIARLEVAAEQLPLLLGDTFRRQVDLAIKAQGFTFVAVDLEPFRSGRMNDALRAHP